MKGIYGIHHICIYTPEIEKSIDFYRNIIGFNLIGRETCDFGEYAMMKLNDSRLELIQPIEQNEDTFGNKGSITHIGLAVMTYGTNFAKKACRSCRSQSKMMMPLWEVYESFSYSVLVKNTLISTNGNEISKIFKFSFPRVDYIIHLPT